MDNILRDLHDHSHRTKAEFIVLLFIQNISKFLTSLPSRIFCQISSTRFQDINRCFSCRCCSKSRLKVGNIHRAMFCVFLHFFRSVLVRNSAISSLDRHGRHFYYYFFSSLVNILQLVDRPRLETRLIDASFPIKYTIASMVYCSQLPNMVSADWL